MKRIFTLSIIVLLLSGCGLYNLSNFTLPNDLEFLAVVNELDTPEKICSYMEENFTYEYHSLYAFDPYILWKIKKGDCNDFATFGTFIANHHGYEVYQVFIYFKKTLVSHIIAVYVENGKYNYSSNTQYLPINFSTFKEVVEHYDKFDYTYEVKNYKVYDYEMNLIEGDN